MIDEFKNKSFSECLELIRAKEMTWIIKRLSGNDTGITQAHQAGIYLPKAFFEAAVPEINTTAEYNPRADISCILPTYSSEVITLNAIYYNSRFFPERGLRKKYNEFRLTKWGGKSCPAQNPENTGCVFVFAVARIGKELEAVALVAESQAEELLIEEWLGREVEPGMFLHSKDHVPHQPIQEFPGQWLSKFPSGAEIFSFITTQLPRATWKTSVDKLLLARRSLEFEVFSAVERAHVFPRIKGGFGDVESFIAEALSVANRRKSRTGTSLELNLSAVFEDEGISFSSQAVTENQKKPDFLFPSGIAYNDVSYPSDRLTMLAAKTCCKDRWRQALSEADRIENKHLFTLQEGVSGNQLAEMSAKHLTLVVPEPNLKSFPEEWRPKIQTLGSFVEIVRQRQVKGI